MAGSLSFFHLNAGVHLLLLKEAVVFVYHVHDLLVLRMHRRVARLEQRGQWVVHISYRVRHVLEGAVSASIFECGLVHVERHFN